jgi:hypothetical protein
VIPVIGVVLAPGQREYDSRCQHDVVHGTVTRWVAGLDCARVPLDTRLDTADWRHCGTPDQFTSPLLARLDAVVTTRLHGLALALRAGILALAVDPIADGGKMSSQARALRWPALVGAEQAVEPVPSTTGGHGAPPPRDGPTRRTTTRRHRTCSSRNSSAISSPERRYDGFTDNGGHRHPQPRARARPNLGRTAGTAAAAAGHRAGQRVDRRHRSQSWAVPRSALHPLPSNVGAAARNLGMAVAGTPYVAFSDDDSWWAPGAFSTAEAVLDAHPKVGLSAAKTLVGARGRADPVTELMSASPLGRAAGLPGPEVLGLLACSAIVRKQAYLQAGGFSPLLHFGAKENCPPASPRGWKLCYIEEIQAHHHPSAVRATSNRRRNLEERNNPLIAWMRPIRDCFGAAWALLRHTVRDPRAAPAVAGAPGRMPCACRASQTATRRRGPDPAALTRGGREVTMSATVLRTLNHMTALPDRAPIIVVDNASTDGSADEAARRHPEVELIRAKENLGAVACDDDTRWRAAALARPAELLDRVSRPRFGHRPLPCRTRPRRGSDHPRAARFAGARAGLAAQDRPARRHGRALDVPHLGVQAGRWFLRTDVARGWQVLLVPSVNLTVRRRLSSGQVLAYCRVCWAEEFGR